MDVFEETNNTLIDELSASSVHTSDLSDLEEVDLNPSLLNKDLKLKRNAKNEQNSDSDNRSRSKTRRKRSLNPKYYSHEFTHDYKRNVSQSRSRSRSSSTNSKGSECSKNSTASELKNKVR